MKHLFRVGMIGLVLSACGGSDEPNFGPETDPTPTQKTAVMSTAQELTLIANANVQGQAAAGAAIEFALTSDALFGTGAAARSVPGLSEVALRLAPVMQRVAPDGCEVITANSVTWNHCQDSGDEIDGMISWSAGRVDIDLHVKANGPTLQFDYAFTGSMTVSPTAIQGDVMVSFNYSSGGTTGSQTLRSQIDVQIASGCITSGTLTVTETGSGAGAQNRAVQIVWTGCNAFRVRSA